MSNSFAVSGHFGNTDTRQINGSKPDIVMAALDEGRLRLIDPSNSPCITGHKIARILQIIAGQRHRRKRDRQG
jgi:hypothetical protein